MVPPVTRSAGFSGDTTRAHRRNDNHLPKLCGEYKTGGAMMCCCGTPIINGQMGYKWQPNDSPHIRPVDPPALAEDEVLLYDEPGRCGGVDAHCHHYRLVKWLSSYYLLVRHGGGLERIPLHTTKSFLVLLEALDTNTRYWLFHTLRYANSDGKQQAAQSTDAQWRMAAAEKRSAVRKQRGQGRVKVWIKPQVVQHAPQ